MSYVGLDIGTTSIKALALSEDGSLLASSSRLLPINYPTPGLAEQDPSEIAQCSIEALEDIARQLDLPPKAIGIANQRETVVAWEKKTMLPLSMAISWQDRRGATRCAELRKLGFEDLVRDITGLTLDPYFSATKYSNIVSALGTPQSKKVALGTVDSWLIANLTSNENPLTDITNASRTSLLNITSNEYEDQLAALFEVPIDLLPTPLPSNAMFGEISHPDLGSWSGTPIHAVLGDQQASLFAQSCINLGDSKATLGTGTFIMTNTGSHRICSSPGLIDSIAWNLSGIGNTYCLEGSIFSTYSTLEWLIDVLGIANNIEELDTLAKSVRTSEQVTLLPFFSGSGSPWWQEGHGAVLAGLDTSSSKGQIAKAGFESIALQIASVINQVQTALDNGIESLKIDGGLSHLDSLCQLIADQSNLQCQAALFAESSAFGAAMMSAVGLGDISPENVSDLYKSRLTFEPSKSKMSAKSREKRWNLYLEKLGLIRE
ncbi:MAG: glycerol kinase [Actinomycetota bacterium]|nr:MAG: glycerol kinase [Actinomycetota bacterium]